MDDNNGKLQSVLGEFDSLSNAGMPVHANNAAAVPPHAANNAQPLVQPMQPGTAGMAAAGGEGDQLSSLSLKVDRMMRSLEDMRTQIDFIAREVINIKKSQS